MSAAPADNVGNAPRLLAEAAGFVVWGCGPGPVSDLPSCIYQDLEQVLPANVRSEGANRIACWHGTVNGRPAWVWRFQIDEPLEFLVFPDSGDIHAHWVSESCRPEDVVALFHGPVMSAILRHRGHIVLHAGAVSVEGRALVVFGASGSGKSTTLAALAIAGHPLLCDDLVVLTHTDGGAFVVAPRDRHLKLWPDSARALGWPADGRQAHALTDKRLVDVDSDPPPALQPVGALVQLDPAGATDGSVERLDMSRAVMTAMGQYYPPSLPLWPDERKAWFTAFNQLIRQAPVFRAHRPSGYAQLPEFCTRLARLARASQ